MGTDDTEKAQHETMHSEKIMVCVGHDSFSPHIIEQVKRQASRMNVPWFAVYVETGRHYRLNKKNQEMVERHMQLAERLGATIVFLKGNNAVEEILDFAKARGISHITVGLRHRGWLRDFLVGTLAETLIRKSNNIEIHVITESDDRRDAHLFFPYIGARSRLNDFVYAIFMMLAFTLIVLPFRTKIEPTNLAMVYLTGMMLVASRFGTWPSILVSVLSVGMFNFFFVEPYHTFYVHDIHYHFTFAVMFIASLLIGSIASRLRLQMTFYRQKEQEIRHLFSLARILSSTRGHDNISTAAAKYIGDVLDATVTIWIPSDTNGLQSVCGRDQAIDLNEKKAAQWAFENNRQSGTGTSMLANAKGRYVPIMEEVQVFGVMGVIPVKVGGLQSVQMTLLEAFAAIIAISLQRATKSQEAENNKIEAEAEKLRNILLQSISHDLRTPLVSISGLSGELLERKGYLPEKAEQMVKTIYDQTSHLSRMVKNILDITGLESGQVRLNKQPYFMEEIIGSALLRLKNILPENAVTFHIHSRELIEVDGLLIEQVFTNLIENAIKYNTGTPRITVSVEDKETYVFVSIADNGSGIARGEEKKIFEKFYKGMREGTGLGLPICKSIIEAHDGRIWAECGEKGGAVFMFTLPKQSATLPENWEGKGDA